MRTWRSKTIALAWLLMAGAAALGVLAFSDIVLVDDAYISFRYSYNLAEGRGLVFNEGEYVEGYTNLLWTLLMALPEFLNIPVHLFAAYGGFAFGLLALFETWRALGVLEVYGWPRGLAVFALGAYAEFWLTATMGLEGGLFAFLLALSARLLFSGRLARAGLVGGMMFATRPESLLLLGVFALYVLFVEGPDRRWFVRLLRLSAPWFGLFTALTLWRFYYYGAWLPNTIAAKAPPEHSLDLLAKNAARGALYTADFALTAAPLVVGLLLALVLDKKSRSIWLCVGAVATELAAILVNGGDWILYHRLLSVFAPVLAVSLGVGIAQLAPRLPGRATPAILLVLLGVWNAFVPGGWDPTPDAEVTEAEPCWQVISEEVKPALLPSDVVALEVLGIFSYQNTEIYSHDLFGLTDRYVAQHGVYYFPQFGKAAPDYTYHDVQPNLILTQSVPTQSGPTFLELMAAASGGKYNEDYRTYELTGLSGCQPPKNFTVAISKEHVSRILPALAELNPQPVQVLGS
jgi:hypothetical protein